jgi:3-methyladenine DNA glycosylase AlkC
MAEPLKAQYGPEVPERIAAMLARAEPAFASRAFVATALRGYEALELLPRARQIARAMHEHLPGDFERALSLVLRSLGPPADGVTGQGMAPFTYLPHVYWVAEHGIDHLEASVAAMHAITRRMSFEFGIRPFLDRYPQEMLAVLERWASDPSPLVRRLVSEGTRPRLPWAPRLRVFGRDPRPVLVLLERLRDDPDDAVRRSVANHLNDLGRQDPALLVALCTAWVRDAPPARLPLVRHALRTLVKRGDPHALTVLGYGRRAEVSLRGARIEPARPMIGGSVEIAFELVSTGARAQRVLVDLRVLYARAAARPRPVDADEAEAADQGRVKVFKLTAVTLAPGETLALRKRLSLRQMSTRTHHPGRHAVEALVNGQVMTVGRFELVPGQGRDPD